ncbi:WhiB family transcriptional regulator [Streptomyces mexicanus]|uniref:WhiB family transcriptional regulator n=1 Tax=Streptomyces mexicanus TaxID=178566 RepID=UPI003669EB17
MTSAEKTTVQLRREWLEHPHFRYRGCAPDPDDPLRMAGNPELHVGAHHGPDAFSPEGQRERRAREEQAIEVCLSCPVMVQCDAYASSVVWSAGVPRVAEPDGVWGGRTSLERHRMLIRSRPERQAAPKRLIQTEQRLLVLRALAAHTAPEAVAEAAGVDVRTANWQRSRLVTQLGLDKRSATRVELLRVAVERGLLDASVVVGDDGSVPAVPPPSYAASTPPAAAPVALASFTDRGRAGAKRVRRAGRPRRGQGGAVPGQLFLFTTNERMEAAA